MSEVDHNGKGMLKRHQWTCISKKEEPNSSIIVFGFCTLALNFGWISSALKQFAILGRSLP